MPEHFLFINYFILLICKLFMYDCIDQQCYTYPQSKEATSGFTVILLPHDTANTDSF